MYEWIGGDTYGNVKVAKINGGAKVMTAGTIVTGGVLTVTMIVKVSKNNKKSYKSGEMYIKLWYDF